MNDRLKAFYEERPGCARMSPLRLTNLEADGWACLKGQCVKAANTRALAPFFASLAAEMYNGETEYGRSTQRAARCMQRMYDILYTAGTFLSPAENAEVRCVCLRFGACLQTLRELARREHFLAWNLTPKCHYSQHLPMQAQLLNPRWCQNYSEESQIGSTTLAWRKSATGHYRRVTQRLVLIKRLVALMVRLEGILE